MLKKERTKERNDDAGRPYERMKDRRERERERLATTLHHSPGESGGPSACVSRQQERKRVLYPGDRKEGSERVCA